ncbi:MAG TPA: cytochrome c3 family protein [Negativicutes bacterium]|jgi:hypothetical protein
MEKGNLQKKILQKKVLLPLLLLLLVAVAGFAAMEKASDKPAFCANCHNMQSYYDSWHEGNLLAKKHADAKVNCHDCHEPSFTQQADEGIKYVTGNFETPLKKREFPKEFCLKCHDYEQVKAKTNFGKSNPHDSHNGEQDCNKCHNMHQQSKIQCAECHTFPWMKKLDDSWQKGK